jgi:aspartate racemase
MKKQKNIIGIIGGVGPQATQYLYGQIITIAQEQYGARNNEDYPHVMIESLPIPDFISDTTKISDALVMLQDSVKRLELAGASHLCIASNTVHILLSELKKNTGLPFISMIDAVVDLCRVERYQTVGLLATPTLTSANLYQKALAKFQITLLAPKVSELPIVENMIRSVIAGDHRQLNKTPYIDLINHLFEQGAESIILGCTELPLAIDYAVLGNRFINSDEVLAQAIVETCYQDTLYTK